MDRYLWLTPLLGLDQAPPDFTVPVPQEAKTRIEELLRRHRLLAAQPPGDGCLVVSEIQPVFETELVDATGQTRVGEPRFCDERGELAVGGALRGSVRHLRCGLLPSGSAG